MITKYDKVFHGVGKLTDVQVHLHINKEIKPVVQLTRQIPFAIREKVESELARLQKEDIIEPEKRIIPLGKSNCSISQTKQPRAD